MTLMDRLDQISRLQGRDPIDYSTIQGSPAPEEIGDPVYPASPTESEDYDDEVESSPLVALGMTPAPETPTRPTPPPLPDFSLVVMDAGAAYKGQAVTLTEPEQAAIAQIVLRAAARRVKEQYDALIKTAPRRVRVKRAELAVTVPTKRKVGRPRKHPLPETGVNSA